ncbi:MAG: hypothetical protein KC776_06845 [Myxococcales bacterium]|nr:hypothetical protein [Myxococcales bacterium]MCB9579185.1 hypothetical protein [Polyangiaceae bacterium]
MSQLRIRGVLRLGVVVAMGGALAGCGSNKDNVEKRLSELRDEIVRLQNNQDRLAERVMAVELARMQEPAAKPKAAAAERVERPPLKVIRLEPDAPAAAPREPSAEEKSQDDASDAPRPVIRVRGKQGLLGPEDARAPKLRQTEIPKAKGA